MRLLRQARPPGEMSVGELVDALGVTQPTVSKHLKVLREGGLVGVREDGQHRYYHFDPEALADLYSWVSALGHGTEEPVAQPFFDLTMAGRAAGGVMRDVEIWAVSLISRLPR
jgi:DNA-binding transcriptional ArsR family regulator